MVGGENNRSGRTLRETRFPQPSGAREDATEHGGGDLPRPLVHGNTEARGGGSRTRRHSMVRTPKAREPCLVPQLWLCTELKPGRRIPFRAMTLCGPRASPQSITIYVSFPVTSGRTDKVENLHQCTSVTSNPQNSLGRGLPTPQQIHVHDSDLGNRNRSGNTNFVSQ